MDARMLCLYVGGVLTAIVGLACGFGASVLRTGNVANWPDVVGSPTALRRVALGLAIVAILLLSSGVAVLCRVPWGFPVAWRAMLLFVAGGFWGNYAVFGGIRPMHTGTNIVLAIVVVGLLWFGLQTP